MRTTCLAAIFTCLPALAIGEPAPMFKLDGTYVGYRLADNSFKGSPLADPVVSFEFKGNRAKFEFRGNSENMGRAKQCPKDRFAGYSAREGVAIPKHSACILFQRSGTERQNVFFLSPDRSKVFAKVFGASMGSRVWLVAKP